MLVTDKNYKIQKLIFFLAQDADENSITAIKKFIRELSMSRSWVIAPPVYFESVEESNNNSAKLVGGELKIYSALPVGSLPYEVDAKHLDEVISLVEVVKNSSEQYMLAFEFELDGIFVGSIEAGKISRTLQKGLIDEWMANLKLRNPRRAD